MPDSAPRPAEPAVPRGELSSPAKPDLLNSVPPPVAAEPVVPPTAHLLGPAGLVPFVFGASLLWVFDGDLQARLATALTAYGAVIVSFLGGIHWGLACRQAAPRRTLLVWGVVPSLLAWLALAMPLPLGLAWLGAALIACYGVDRRVYAEEGASAWLPLRWRLTVVASLSCFVGAAGSAL